MRAQKQPAGHHHRHDEPGFAIKAAPERLTVGKDLDAGGMVLHQFRENEFIKKEKYHKGEGEAIEVRVGQAFQNDHGSGRHP